jgi:DNA-directed RNA polymerase specialized sigma24 family protein
MDVAYQLDREWLQLAPTEIARVLPRWHKHQPQLRRFCSARDLLAFLHTASGAQTDAPLLALLALARDDKLAGRTLLQVLLPALKAQAERIACASCQRDEVWEVLLYFAWETICTYPLERRRVGVATKLVLDVLHHATRELHRQPVASYGSPQLDRRPLLPSERTRAHDMPPPDERADAPITQPAPLPTDAVLVAAVAAGVLHNWDVELILRTRVDGIRLRLLAQALGLSYHALRQRRQRAEKRLREFLAASRDVSNQPLSTLVSSERSLSLPTRARPAATASLDAFAERAA